MRRRKRNTILRIALGLTIAAIVPATALAKPVPVNQDVENHGQYQLGLDLLNLADKRYIASSENVYGAERSVAVKLTFDW